MEKENTPPWYFLHIPKTAGTTFRVLLENQFHMDAICPAYEFFQIKQYSQEQLARFRLFRGHMGYNLANYLQEKPRTLVMLRDPMERAISHFEYICRDPAHPKHRIIHERKLGLKEYLLDPVLSAEVTNAQVRPLAHMAERSLLQELLDNSDSQENFARAWRHRNGVLPADDELLDVALQRLESMAFVGITEDLERGMELAAWLLGTKPQQQQQSLNINPRRTPLEDLPAETLDILRRVTALDARLYERGRELFQAQYQRMAGDGGRPFPSAGCAAQEGTDGSVVVDFVQPLHGRGWHQRELVAGKGILRWTGPETKSHIDVALPAGRGYRLKISIADWVSETVLHSLRLHLDEERLPVELVDEDGQLYALADIDAAQIHEGNSIQRLYLRLNEALPQSVSDNRAIDHSHARKVGIAVCRFDFFLV